jgi:hypothetical protein
MAENNIFLKTMFHKIYGIDYEFVEDALQGDRLWREFIKQIKIELEPFIKQLLKEGSE